MQRDHRSLEVTTPTGTQFYRVISLQNRLGGAWLIISDGPALPPSTYTVAVRDADTLVQGIWSMTHGYIDPATHQVTMEGAFHPM